MTYRELMQQALNLLDDINQCSLPPTGIPLPAEIDHVMEALRARLEQPEPEPVAWYYAGSDVEWHSIALDADLDDAQKANCTPLYTAPPFREWQGLTDETEIKHCWYEACQTDLELTSQLVVYFARAIEAKLKEKNGF